MGRNSHQHKIVMEEQLVEFETAQLAREKGFDWLCYSWFFISKIDAFDNVPRYYRDKAIADYVEIDDKLVSHLIGGQHGKTINTKFKNSEDQPCVLACPTQELLKKWLRKTHSIEVFVRPFINCETHYKHYKCYIMWFDGKIYQDNKVFSAESYEVVLEEGLLDALKLIKKWPKKEE